MDLIKSMFSNLWYFYVLKPLSLIQNFTYLSRGLLTILTMSIIFFPSRSQARLCALDSVESWSILFPSPLKKRDLVLGFFSLWGLSFSVVMSLCFNCGALLSQHGMLCHQRHYQAFNIISPFNKKGLSNSYLAFFFAFDLGLGFNFGPFWSFPFGFPLALFVCTYPLCFET